jgi:hypothetical protein
MAEATELLEAARGADGTIQLHQDVRSSLGTMPVS